MYGYRCAVRAARLIAALAPAYANALRPTGGRRERIAVSGHPKWAAISRCERESGSALMRSGRADLARRRANLETRRVSRERRQDELRRRRSSTAGAAS